MSLLQSWWLKRKLRSASANTRREAIAALAGANDAGAVALLASALADADSYVASDAIEALAKIRTPAALDALVKALREMLTARSIRGAKPSEYRFNDLIEAVAEFGPTAFDGLAAVLENRDREIAAQTPVSDFAGINRAVEALGAMRDPRALPVLAARLKEDWVGYMAARAIAQNGQPGLDLLIAKLSDPNETVRRNAIDGIVDFKDAQAVPALRGCLSDGDPEVRAAAARALGELRDTAAVPALVKCLDDWNEKVRRQVAATLEALAWRPTKPRETDLLAVAKGEVHAATRRGPAGIRGLIRDIAAAYDFAALAKNDDALAIRQIGWAMRKKMADLPELEVVAAMVKALEQILERSGAKADAADLRMLTHLPDLKARYIAEITRENYHSGAEYTERVPSETVVSCERVRSVAAELATKR